MKRVAFLTTSLAALAWPQPAAAETAQAQAERIATQLPGTLGVYARTLSGAQPLVAVRAFERFPTASVIKVLVMATAYAMEEQNPGTLATEIVTHRSDLIGGSDFMVNARDGERFTVLQLIVPMIQLSDNTAANALIAHFGTDLINSMGRAAGMLQTTLGRKFMDFAAIEHHSDNLSTPFDMAQLLYQIEEASREGVATIVTPEHARAMIRIMLGQTDRSGIPAGIPNVPVANKTGAISFVRNDVAIVEPFGDVPFILSIFTKDLQSEAAGYGAMQRLARIALLASRTSS